MNWVVILAGGEGTRFWPQSRRTFPKQFQKLASRQSLLEETVGRLRPFVPPQRIVVVTHKLYRKQVRKLLPEIPNEHILGEPEGKSTAPSIAWVCAVIEKKDPEATLIILPSDHWIGDKARFQKALRLATELVEDDLPVTFGIRPFSAHTGYGYLRCKKRRSKNGLRFYEADRFLEKPSKERAQKLYRSGSYLWNSGMFVFKIGTLKKLMARHLRAIARGFARWAKSDIGPAAVRRLHAVYRGLPKISIDYGLMEKLSRFYVIEAPFRWWDLGDWCEAAQFLAKDIHGNRVRGPVFTLRSRGNIVQGNERLIALLGVKDLIVVDTEDALLICSRDKAQEVKALVEALKRSQWSSYL